MADSADTLASSLLRLDSSLFALLPRCALPLRAPLDKWRIDAGALAFHLRNAPSDHPITVLLGGTGTGKSTLTNRLVNLPVSATSFRRTYTAGAVVVLGPDVPLPADWLGTEHVPVVAADLPAKGELGRLLVVQLDQSALAFPLVDTPDLDGDQPGHPLQADRAFRWGQRAVFVVTPEKYQMTELLPYYRLARRYEVPCLFVMNKCEEPAVVEDFRRQLVERGFGQASVFVVPRDDAAYEAPPDTNLATLRSALNQPAKFDATLLETGRRHRIADAVNRLGDQVINPLRDARQNIDELLRALAAMEAPTAGVDVNPITVQLQRRLQQRSVLYLIGPQRVLDRLRQMPALLARLPRASWDWIVRGQVPADLDPQSAAHPGEPPDFPAILADQFTVVRSRIDDVLRSSPAAPAWLAADPGGYAGALLPPAAAGAIATEEIADLKQWLETRWNATPRDTRMLQAFLKYLPGGQKLTKWTEAAPYLLTIAVIAHHAIFGHVDLMVLGGYSLATWLTEKLSNEVGNRTRRTNRRITERFEKLTHEQLRRVAEWLDRQAPSRVELERLDQLAGELAAAAGA